MGESHGSALTKVNTLHSMREDEMRRIMDVDVFLPHILVQLRNLGLI